MRRFLLSVSAFCLLGTFLGCCCHPCHHVSGYCDCVDGCGCGGCGSCGFGTNPGPFEPLIVPNSQAPVVTAVPAGQPAEAVPQPRPANMPAYMPALQKPKM